MGMNGQKVRSVNMFVCVSSGHITMDKEQVDLEQVENHSCVAKQAQSREAKDFRVCVRKCKGEVSRKFNFLFLL